MQKELVDFSDCEASINKYDGAVYKHPIMYRGERYILKYDETLSRLTALPITGRTCVRPYVFSQRMFNPRISQLVQPRCEVYVCGNVYPCEKSTYAARFRRRERKFVP